jgi:hypothetical protein
MYLKVLCSAKKWRKKKNEKDHFFDDLAVFHDFDEDEKC